jgi:uncharacterized membrane protein YtjA (UPF0391 family)
VAPPAIYGTVPAPLERQKALGRSGSSWRIENMLHYALVFLVVAIIAAVLGVSGVAAMATNIAYILFVVALVLFVVHLLTGRRTLTP